MLSLCAFFMSAQEGFSQSKKKTAPKKSSTTAVEKSKNEVEKEIKAAEKLVAKLKSSQKSKFTKVVKSGKTDDLMKLPGIGEVNAAAIIKARPLKSSAHLVTVKGIGPKTFANIVDYYSKGLDAKKPEPKKPVAKKPAPKKSTSEKK